MMIALTGFMACGKSTVGHALAWLLKWRFIDLDCEIECRFNQSICEIFTQQGEPGFRELEAKALSSVVEGATTPTVIALGGGTFVQPQNAELLQRWGVHVVFLEVAVEELLQRLRAAEERSPSMVRPLATDNESLFALHAQRLPLYRRADIIVNSEDKTPEEIAREIAKALQLTVHAHQPPQRT